MTLLVLVAILSLGLCNGNIIPDVKILKSLEIDENMVEPRLELWKLLNKPGGRSLLKNVIASIEKYDSYKKIHEQKTQNKIKNISTIKSPNDQSTTSSVRPQEAYSVSENNPVDHIKIFKNLQLQIEEKKHFFHSIVDGWTY